MKKILKIILWVFLGCLSLFIMVFAAVSLWAAAGPRDISAYSNYIEKSINGALENNHIVIGKTYIKWDGLDGRLAVKATEVELYNNSQQKIAAFPEIILKYGLRSLFTGYLVPSQLKLIEPVIDLSNLIHKGNDQGLDFQDLNLGRLDKVSIVNGKLTAPGGNVWDIPKATLWYSQGNIRVDAAINRPDGEAVEASLKTNPSQSDSLIRVSFTNFNTGNLVYFFPELAPARFIVNGRASFTAHPNQKLASFDVDNFTGEFNDANLFKYKLNIKAGKISGQYDVDKKILDIKNVQAAFTDGFNLSGKGLVTGFNQFDVEANFTNLKTTSLKVYWPNLAPADPITWANEHLKGGIVTDGTLKLQISPEEIASGKLTEKAIDLKFNCKDISATYFKDLTPISNASGSGVMDANSLKINVTSAMAGNSHLGKSDVEIYDIDTPIEKIAINAQVDGTVEDLADFYLKLHKGKQLIKSKSDVTGKATSSVKLRMPLLKALDIEDVDYTIKTEISEATAKNLLDKLDLEKMKVSLDIGNKAYDAKGSGFASYNRPSKNLAIKAAPTSFEVAATDEGIRVAAISDIVGSSLEFAPLEIKKPIGEPGKLYFEIIDTSNTATLNKLTLDSKPLQIAGRGSLKKDYTDFLELQLDKVQIGETKLIGKIASTPYLTAEFKGPYFDARPFIRYLNSDHEEDDSEFKVLMKADKVALLNDQSFSSAYVALHCAKNCDTISINSNELSFNQTSANLTAEAENAGNVLKAFDLYTNMVGGKLVIKAKVDGDLYDGRVMITDFNIVKARILARMLTLGSLTGIADLMQGNGIRFKKLASNIRLDKHRAIIKDFRMVGPAIGLTADGDIDRDRDLANLSGNIIPAYTANTLLGHIPLLGDVIIGDEGVFALAYTLKGNTDDPTISVNPLSVLAPGFLKNVFQ